MLLSRIAALEQTARLIRSANIIAKGGENFVDIIRYRKRLHLSVRLTAELLNSEHLGRSTIRRIA
jgi:predicted transport protein